MPVNSRTLLQMLAKRTRERTICYREGVKKKHAIRSACHQNIITTLGLRMFLRGQKSMHGKPKYHRTGPMYLGEPRKKWNATDQMQFASSEEEKEIILKENLKVRKSVNKKHSASSLHSYKIGMRSEYLRTDPARARDFNTISFTTNGPMYIVKQTVLQIQRTKAVRGSKRPTPTDAKARIEPNKTQCQTHIWQTRCHIADDYIAI